MKYDFHNFRQSEYMNPGRRFSPVMSWVWNAPVSESETVRQLDEMAEQGIRCCYVIPEPKAFRPTSQITTMEPDYLTPEFFGAIKFAADYADSIGISVWLYDEGGWPSGSACGNTLKGHPELRSKRLCENEPYYTEVGAPDLLSKATLERFISLTHEGYAEVFGDKLPSVSCMFTDEPTPVWPPYLDPEEFKAEYGYDYIPYIKDIISDCECGARADYCDMWSRKAADVFYGSLQSWANGHGILSVGHTNDDHEPAHYYSQGGHILRFLRKMDIPGIDAIWGQICCETAGDMIFPHFASSAAAQRGNICSLTESFAIYGCGCDYEKMRYVLCHQAVRGINVFNFMSRSYGNGRFEASQARPDYRGEYPSMEGMKPFSDFVSRLSYVASCGRPAVRSALYYPIRNIWAADRKGGERLKEAFIRIGRGLDEMLCPYDIIDPDFIAECSVKEGTLTNGSVTYSAVYIPGGAELTENEKKKLLKFESEGGRVFFDIAVVEPESGGPLFDIRPQRCGIRASKRVDDDGNVIYLLYNESAEKCSFNYSFRENMPCYTLDLESGNIVPAVKAGDRCLGCGECIAFIFTEKEIECGAAPAVRGRMIAGFESFDVHIVSEFEITPDGVRNTEKQGEIIHTSPQDYSELFGEGFSGCAEYEITLPYRESECILDCGEVRCVCEAILGDESLGLRCMPPYVFRVPAGNSQKLKLRVSSTAAAAYASFDASSVFSPAETGPYNARMTVLEKKDRCGGILSPCALYTLEK